MGFRALLGGSIVALALLGSACSAVGSERSTVARTGTAPCGPAAQAKASAAPPRFPLWYASDSLWNTPLACNPAVDSRSKAYVDALLTAAGEMVVNSQQWTPRVFYASASSPRTDIPLANNWKIDGVPMPRDASPTLDSDGHLMVMDPSTGCEYDFFGAKQAADGSWSAFGQATFRISGSGVHQPWSARASGLALGVGLIRLSDVYTGRIQHALTFAYPLTAPRFVAPATTSDGRTRSDAALPMGSLLQLDPTIDLDAFRPRLAPWQKMIARAMQTYGMYLADTSSSLTLYAENVVDSPHSYPWAGRRMPAALLRSLRVLKPPAAPKAVDTFTFAGCAQRHRVAG